MEEKKSSKSLHLQILHRSLIYFIIMLVFSFIIISGFTFVAKNRLLIEYKLKAIAELEYQRGLIQNYFQSVRSDLLFLPQLNEMISFTEVSNEDVLIYIENEFLEFTRSKLIYDQIRYIDAKGMELTRINFNAGHPSIVEKSDLQNKRDRYYFSNTVSIKKGEVYISPFDLNKERGEIELPLKPMIRFGTPVFDSENRQKGIIILNYLGDSLLQDLRTAGINHPGEYSLLNMDGYWLYSNNPEDSWGFMYPNKQDVTLSNRRPEVWNSISNSMESQFLSDGTLITSLIFTPFPEISSNQQKQSWILLNTISPEEMGRGRKFLIPNLLYVLLICICAFFAWLLSIIVVHRNHYREALKYSALYDRLTGLANRILLEDRAKQVIAEAGRYSRIYALFFIDLDGFKVVNDTIGHDAGDELLKQVGKRLKSCVRSSDTVCRFGGDEFIILLSQIENEEDCGKVAMKILENLSRKFSLIGGTADISCSIGIAIGHPAAEENLESLTQKADRGMYEVKSTGKNNFRIV